MTLQAVINQYIMGFAFGGGLITVAVVTKALFGVGFC